MGLVSDRARPEIRRAAHRSEVRRRRRPLVVVALQILGLALVGVVTQLPAGASSVWGATTAPTAGLSPAAASNPAATLTDTACPRVGSCIAVGSYVDSLGDTHGVIETLTGATWTAMTAPTSGLSPTPGLNPAVSLRAVACPAAGSCVVVGTYKDLLGNTQGFFEGQSGSSWTATNAPLSSLSPAAGTNPTISWNGVRCSGISACAAVGSYVDSSGNTQGLLAVLAFTWTATTAPTSGLSPGAGTNPTISLNGVSCPGVNACMAVGTYKDSGGNTQGLIEEQSGSGWAATTAPTSGLSPGAGTNPTISLNGVSCPVTNTCVSVGTYKDTLGNTDGVIETLVSGWTAMTAPTAGLSPAESTSPIVALKAVSCPATGSCAAVGSYADTLGHTQGLIEVLSVATWTSTTAPTGALSPSTGVNPTAVLNDVTCPKSGSCVTVGTYLDVSLHTQGLIEVSSSGSWATTTAPFASLSPAAGANPTVTLPDLSCAKVGWCVADGSYLDSSGNTRGLLETYGQPPVVTRVRPSYGPATGRTRVRIFGHGFVGTTAVDFGSTPATSFQVDKPGNRITAIAPPGTGVVFVTVVAPLGASPNSPTSQFSYAPAIRHVHANSGRTAGGGRVVIVGTNLASASAVDFGSTPATHFLVRSNREIIATSPPSAPGTVDVTVTSPGGTSPLTSADTYTFH